MYIYIRVCCLCCCCCVSALFSLFLKGNLCNYTIKTKKIRLRRAINAIVVYIIYTTMEFQKSLTMFSGAPSRELTLLLLLTTTAAASSFSSTHLPVRLSPYYSFVGCWCCCCLLFVVCCFVVVVCLIISYVLQTIHTSYHTHNTKWPRS